MEIRSVLDCFALQLDPGDECKEFVSDMMESSRLGEESSEVWKEKDRLKKYKKRLFVLYLLSVIAWGLLPRDITPRASGCSAPMGWGNFPDSKVLMKRVMDSQVSVYKNEKCWGDTGRAPIVPATHVLMQDRGSPKWQQILRKWSTSVLCNHILPFLQNSTIVIMPSLFNSAAQGAALKYKG